MTAPVARYDAASIGVHWLTVLLFLFMAGSGIALANLAFSPFKLQLYTWHKSIGILVLTLTVLRLLWHVYKPAPPLPASLSKPDVYVARGVHVLLYFLLLAIPLSGWLMSSATGLGVVLFGLWPLPDLIAPNANWIAPLKTTHEYLAFTAMGLVTLHAAAALMHHYYKRTPILWRMLPLMRRPKGVAS